MKKSRSVSDLFFSDNPAGKRKRRSIPCTIDEYRIIILDAIKMINPDIDDNLIREKYDIYLNTFGGNSINPTAIGFYSITQCNIKYYTSRGWDTDTAIRFVRERQTTYTNNKFVKRYGEIYGPVRFKESKKKHSETFSRNYKEGRHRKFFRPSEMGYWINNGVEESSVNDEMFKYYSSIGKKHYKKRRDAGIETLTPRQLRYWLSKGLSYDEAHAQLRSIQDTRSLNFCVKKYGKIEGAKKFNERNKKWLKTLAEKSESDKLDILIRKTKRLTRYSKKSIHLFKSVLLNLLNEHNISFKKVYMAENEFFIYDHDMKRINFYDMFIQEIKLIVEYNGIMYHPRKERMDDSEWVKWHNIISGTSADEQLKIDEYKANLAVSHGYEYLILWEDESFDDLSKKLKTKILELYEQRNDKI